MLGHNPLFATNLPYYSLILNLPYKYSDRLGRMSIEQSQGRGAPGRGALGGVGVEDHRGGGGALGGDPEGGALGGGALGRVRTDEYWVEIGAEECRMEEHHAEV